MCCHVCKVGGAVPSVTKRWCCFQALFVGLPGLLVVLLVLQVCVATTTAVFSCKAIVRHRSSAHLKVSHTPNTSPCVWLCRTFCGRWLSQDYTLEPLRIPKIRVCWPLTSRLSLATGALCYLMVRTRRSPELLLRFREQSQLLIQPRCHLCKKQLYCKIENKYLKVFCFFYRLICQTKLINVCSYA